jgi:purine-binding chemotaxis protein CheW
MSSHAPKYLSFRLAGDDFGIELERVKEIMALQEITPLEGAPAFVKGAIAMRGDVFAAIDMRTRLGLPAGVYSHRTGLIVLCGSDISVVLIVDYVSGVVGVRPEDIEAPAGAAAALAPYLLGVVRERGRARMLLNPGKVLDCEELRELRRLVY